MRGYVFMVFIAPSGYIVRLLVTNTISVEEIWVLYSIIGMIVLLSAYNDLWLTEALQYFAPKYWLEKKYNELTTIFWWTMMAQLLSGSVIWWALRRWADRIAINYFTSPLAGPILQIYALYFLAINIVQAFNSLLQAFQDSFTSQALDFVRNMILVWSVSRLRWARDLTVISFSRAQMWAQLAIGIIWAIVIMTLYRRVVCGGHIIRSPSLMRSQLWYAWWIFLGVNMMLLFGQIDLQMVLWIGGQAQAWYYATYQSLLGLPFILIGPILNLLFATTTELHTKQDHQKIWHYLRFMSQYLWLFGLIIGGFFAMSGPSLASVLYGSKMAYSGVLLSMSSIFIPIIILLSYWGLVMGGIGAAKYRGVVFGIAVVINIILNSILIPLIGSPGAVIATGCSRLYMTIAFGRYIYELHRFSLDRWFRWRNMMIIICLVAIYHTAMMRNTPWIISDSVPARLYNLSIIGSVGVGYVLIIARVNKVLVQELWKQVQEQRGWNRSSWNQFS